MGFQIPIVGIAVAVRVLGPKAVIRLKAIHKNMVKAKKQDMSEKEYLSFHVNKKRLADKAKDKTMPSRSLSQFEKKAAPEKITTKEAKRVEKAFANKAKKEDVLVSVFNKETKKYKQYDIRNMSKQELFNVPNRSNKLISKWIQYHERGGVSPKSSSRKNATKVAVKKIKEGFVKKDVIARGKEKRRR